MAQDSTSISRTPTRPVLALTLTVLFLAVLPDSPRAADGRELVLDHPKISADFATEVEMVPGQFFDVILKRSTESFRLRTYAYEASPARAWRLSGTQDQPPLKTVLQMVEAELMQADSVLIAVPHRTAFSGYMVEVSLSAPSLTAFEPSPGRSRGEIEHIAEQFVERMNSAAWVERVARDSAETLLRALGSFHTLRPFKVFVRPTPASYRAVRLAGGFCASWLTNERYRTEQVGAELLLRRDRDAESRLRPLAVAFLHVTPLRSRPVGLALGLGANGESNLTILPGLSVLVGDAMFVSVGVHIGAVDTKPVGTAVNGPIQDAGVLTKPDSKHKAMPFIAFTYSFLGAPEETFKKPFAEPPKSAPNQTGQD